MKGFIITGHGNFATGMLSSINLIAGSIEKIIAVDFLPVDSSETLKTKLIDAMHSLKTKEILIFCDLLGGSPFKEAVELAIKRKNIEVVAGTNLPMITENVFLREHMTLEEIRDNCINVGRLGIDKFELKTYKAEEAFGGI